MVNKTPGANRESRNTLTATGGLILTGVCSKLLDVFKTVQLYSQLNAYFGCEARHVRGQGPLHHSSVKQECPCWLLIRDEATHLKFQSLTGGALLSPGHFRQPTRLDARCCLLQVWSWVEASVVYIFFPHIHCLYVEHFGATSQWSLLLMFLLPCVCMSRYYNSGPSLISAVEFKTLGCKTQHLRIKFKKKG